MELIKSYNIKKIFEKKLILISSLFFFLICFFWTFFNWDLAYSLNNNINDAIQIYEFVPFISLFFEYFFSYFLNENIKIIFGNMIIPTISFYLLCNLLNKSVSELFSISMSYLAFFSFSESAFRNFILSLLNNSIVMETKPLEIMSFPIPSISTMFFLLLFYYSININFNYIKICIMTVLWSLFFYIHPVDAIFGISFWLSYVSISIFYRKSNYSIKATFYNLVIQILIFLLIVGYSIMTYEFINIKNTYLDNISFYYYFAYFFLPSVLIFILFIIKKIDPFEILFKFQHIYILMFVEFTLILFFTYADFAIDSLIIKNRIALFFLHIYYYVPIIYYCNKPSMNFNNNKINIFYLIDKSLFILVNKLSYYYLPIIIIALHLYVLASF